MLSLFIFVCEKIFIKLIIIFILFLFEKEVI